MPTRFIPFEPTPFGTCSIQPVGEVCVRLEDHQSETASSIVLTLNEAISLREILNEILADPASPSQTSREP